MKPGYVCLTCLRPLKPQTSVPRASQVPDNTRWDQYRYEQGEKRQAEIATGKVGYLGQAQFCNVQCAAFFARATTAYFGHSNLYGYHKERLLEIGVLARKVFTWVAQRAPKQKARKAL